MNLKIIPKGEQVLFAKSFLEEGGIGRRGEFDGDVNQQLFGMIGQIIITDLLGIPRPKNNQMFDGGYDFIYGGKKWDVKVLIGSVPFKKRFVQNVNAWQISYACDGFVFLYYEKKTGIYTITGWISKEEFLKKAELFPPGCGRIRENGTVMITKNPMYEIKNRQLIDFSKFKNLEVHDE